MKQLIILVAPPGAGKTTLAKEYEANGYVRISQDDMGRDGHLEAFKNAVTAGRNIIVDRMGFSKDQRKRYIPPSSLGYNVECIVLHENQATCLERMLKREGHPTIKDEESARSALHTFFSKYEKPDHSEGINLIKFQYPERVRLDDLSCIICDIDGTIANLDHRLHHIKGDKKDWRTFLSKCDLDEPKQEVINIVKSHYYYSQAELVVCSGRGQEYKQKTIDWLAENNMYGDYLFMREVKRFLGLLPEYHFRYGSNNVDITGKGEKHTGYYGEDIYGKAFKAINAEEKIDRNELVFGEIIGEGIQKGYHYGHKEPTFVLFDVKVFGADGEWCWLSPKQVQQYAEERGFKYIPVLYRGPYSKAIADSLLTGADPYYPQHKIREGIVIKSEDYNDSQCSSKKRALKYVNPEYLDRDQTDYH